MLIRNQKLTIRQNMKFVLDCLFFFIENNLLQTRRHVLQQKQVTRYREVASKLGSVIYKVSSRCVVR